MKLNPKNRIILFVYALLFVFQPVMTLSGMNYFSEPAKSKDNWWIGFDKAVKKAYDDVGDTFIGGAVLRQTERIVPVIIASAIAAYIVQWMMKNQAQGLISHEIKPIVVTDTTLADYAGAIPPAVLTLVDQIENREYYKKLNAPVTKGVLLTGLPGTGKSFLARAIAGTVKGVFIATSATEFSQPYVGTSEIMVRDVFNKARIAAEEDPSKLAIIFVDEIDAIGKRGTTLGGLPIGTLQTFLTEMDGFNGKASTKLPWYKRILGKQSQDIDVVVLAATNKPGDLDPALKRKGRFDHIIEVEKPDEAGRRAIVALYLKKYPHDATVTVDRVTPLTVDMSPAEINALFGEAARNAGSERQSTINIKNFQYALPQIKTTISDDQNVVRTLR